ncbi:MAG: FAD-binding protein [Azospirillaceae bacterium]
MASVEARSTLRAASETQVAEAVAWALSARAPLELVSHGSKRSLGRPVEAAGVLDLSGLAGVTLYEPDELVLSCGPGTPLVELEDLLAGRRQRFAFEPPDLGPLLGHAPGQASIGGVVAGNLSGPRRIQAGAARDHLLGLRGVNGRGETFKTGGRVMKNVTGYDLCKLLTGSHGTLAAFTMLTLKVLPSAEREATLVLHGLAPDDGLALLRRALGGPYDVSGAAHLPAGLAGTIGLDQPESATLLRIDGFAPSVDDRLSSLRDLAREGEQTVLDDEASAALWRGIRDVQPFVGQEGIVWRLSVTPTEAAVAAERIAGRHGGQVFFDWGGGLIWLLLDEVADDTVRGAASAAGGHATLIRAPEPVRSTVPVFQPQPPALAALTRRVKQGFDPQSVLNRGRMWAGV